MRDIEKVIMTVNQCCSGGKGSRDFLQLKKIWPPRCCGRENNIDHTIVSLALFVTSLQVCMMYRLYPKRDQLDKWVFQIKHLIPKFHGGRVLWCLCCSLCLDCICRIQKNFYLETRVWGPVIMKMKVWSCHQFRIRCMLCDNSPSNWSLYNGQRFDVSCPSRALTVASRESNS